MKINRIKSLIPILLLFFVIVLALRKSNLDWHQSQNYLILFGRYSTEYFFLMVTLFLFSVALCIHFLPTPKTRFKQGLKQFFEGLLIVSYTLTGFLIFSEYIFHHNPLWSLGPKQVLTLRDIHLAGTSGVPDKELGKLGTPNASTKNGQAIFDQKYRYPPSPWRDVPAPFTDYRSDAHGFRNNREWEKVDLVVLGDSFTHGPHVQREQIWSSLLAKRFGLTEINLAMAGFCPRQEAIVLQRYGLPKKPAGVIMQFYYGNDLYESARFERWRRSGKTYEEFSKVELGPESQLFLTWEFLKRLLITWFPQSSASTNEPVECLLNDEKVKMGFHRSLQFLNHEKEEILQHEGWEPMVGAIQDAYELCSERDIIFIVCLVPQKISVYLDYIVDQENRERLIHQQFPERSIENPVEFFLDIKSKRDNFNELMHTYLKKHAIPFVDLTSTFRLNAQSEDKLLYFPVDSHWTPEGHHLAAETVGDFIERNYLQE